MVVLLKLKVWHWFWHLLRVSFLSQNHSILMGMERMGACVEKDKVDKLPIPPGFVSLTSFTLKRLRNGEESCSSSTFGSEFVSELAHMDTSSNRIDPTKLKKHLQCRPWILHNQFNHIVEESVPERLDMVIFLLCHCSSLSFRMQYYDTTGGNVSIF